MLTGRKKLVHFSLQNCSQRNMVQVFKEDWIHEVYYTRRLCMGKKICDSRTWFKNEFSKNSDIHMLTDEELKKLHDIELEMLCDFLKVVKEQNIS